MSSDFDDIDKLFNKLNKDSVWDNTGMFIEESNEGLSQ